MRTDFTKPDPAFVPKCDYRADLGDPTSGTTFCDRPVAWVCDCPRCAAGGGESFYACEGHLSSRAIAMKHQHVYPSRTMHLVPLLTK